MSDAKVDVWLMTRGRRRAADYRWFPHPPRRWWDAEPFSTYSMHDNPTLVVTSDGARWRLYANQIESGRRDAVGSAIYWSVAAESFAPGGNDLVILLDQWLRSDGALGRSLDEQFPDVDDWFSEAPVATLVTMPRLNPSSLEPSASDADHVLGGVDADGAVAKAVSLAADLLALKSDGSVVYTSITPSGSHVDEELGPRSVRLHPGSMGVREAEVGGDADPKRTGRDRSATRWAASSLFLLLILSLTVVILVLTTG